MSIVFVILGAVMFVDCILLVFLVLLQLPKKEAGAGMAFGGAATDALFGAGSGNALTTITKYSACVFFGAAIMMAFITSHTTKSTDNSLEKTLTSPGAGATAPVTPGPAGSGFINLGSSTNGDSATTNASPATTNAAATATTNAGLPATTQRGPSPATNK